MLYESTTHLANHAIIWEIIELKVSLLKGHGWGWISQYSSEEFVRQESHKKPSLLSQTGSHADQHGESLQPLPHLKAGSHKIFTEWLHLISLEVNGNFMSEVLIISPRLNAMSVQLTMQTPNKKLDLKYNSFQAVDDPSNCHLEQCIKWNMFSTENNLKDSKILAMSFQT